MHEPIRVLIVDDHFIVRMGIQALIDELDGIEVVGEAEDGRQAVELAASLEPDVVLMDMMMPEMDGVEATRAILAARPETRIVVLTTLDVDGREILEAVRAGVVGYLAKTASRQEIQDVIGRVHRGEPAFPAEVTRKLLGTWDGASASAGPPQDLLTEREIEILRHLAKGLSNQQIGERVFISEATVRTHVSRILSKLELSNRVEAVLYALREGIARLEESAGP